MLPSQRDLFDIPRDVCYLNSASYSPLPIQTLEAGSAAVLRKGRPWTLDAGFANRQHERARTAAARLINAEAADIALIPSISYGVATAAKLLTIPRGTRVLVLENDHSSPVLEWQTRSQAQAFTIETVRQPDDGDWTSVVLAAIERSGAPPVGLASISSVHWSDGSMIDLDKVRDALRRHGARFLIDATQSAGVLPLDVGRLDPDFLMFPTYKWLLGPYGRAFHRHGDDGGLGRKRRRAASCHADGAHRGWRARHRRRCARAPPASPAYPEPRVQARDAARSRRGTGQRRNPRRGASRPPAHLAPRLQRRRRRGPLRGGAGPAAAKLARSSSMTGVDI
jgi:Aminotransferase class-V